MEHRKVGGKAAHARLQFANWLKENHPELFSRAIAIAEKSASPQNELNGLGEQDAPKKNFWDTFTTAALGLGTTYLALQNQKDAMKINLARARAGQPPIDIATSAPVVRTQVDLSPELTGRLLSTAGAGITKTLLWAGAALAAFFVFK